MTNLQTPDRRYILAVMRSRQHTLKYESVLKRSGMQVEVISTPREAAIGCGLSLKIGIQHMQKLLEMWRYNRPEGLAGIYLVEPGVGRKLLKSIRILTAKY